MAFIYFVGPQHSKSKRLARWRQNYKLILEQSVAVCAIELLDFACLSSKLIFLVSSNGNVGGVHVTPLRIVSLEVLLSCALAPSISIQLAS